jgi:transcriptional regulator with XRE-family HTH domain
MTTPTNTDWFIGPGEGDNREFGAWMQALRHTAGLTRAEAANRLSLSSEYLRLIERGKRTPASGNMVRFCEVYELIGQREGSNSWLIEGKMITFTSRILEARQSNSDDSDISKMPTRWETLGWIVDHLGDADELTLTRVQKLLKEDLGLA